MTILNPTPLKLFGLFVTLFGLILTTAGFTTLLGSVDGIFKLFHPGESHPVWSEHMRFSTGLMGAITLGWGLTLFSLAKHSHEMPIATARAVWTSITLSMMIWFVIDTVISVSNGYWVNGLSNAIVSGLYFLALRQSGLKSWNRSTQST